MWLKGRKRGGGRSYFIFEQERIHRREEDEATTTRVRAFILRAIKSKPEGTDSHAAQRICQRSCLAAGVRIATRGYSSNACTYTIQSIGSFSKSQYFHPRFQLHRNIEIDVAHPAHQQVYRGVHSMPNSAHQCVMYIEYSRTL